MKKIFYIILLISLAFSTVNAQQRKPHKGERIEALRVEFMLKRLNLPATDAEKFSFLYKSYIQETNLLFKQKRAAREVNKNDAQKLVDDDFFYDEKLIALKKQYRKRFQQVLSAEEIKTLYLAEREFREELIKQLQNK